MKKYWLIASIDTTSCACYLGMTLPDYRRPSYIHYYKREAEEELLRLQKRYPEQEFVLFESIAYCKSVGIGEEFNLDEIIN